MADEMSEPRRVGFVGAGRMAEAIAQGLIRAGKVEAKQVLASAPTDKNLCHFRALGCQTTHSNHEVLQNCPLVIFATKPQVLPAVLAEVAPVVTTEHIIVSVAAGISLSSMEELLPPKTRVLRVSPNLPCVVQEGAMVMTRGHHAGNEDAKLLQNLLEACGQCIEVPESYVDIHTGLSGSGVCTFSEALAEGAIKMGMPSDLAHRIAAQTLLGTAKMLQQEGKHPAQLRTDVLTPAGTTIHGLHALEQGGFRAAAMSAVEAATCRAKELSKNRKMATNFLMHEKIWFDKFKYDDAERRFYEQMNGPVTAGSRQENGASVILRDIARARENIQKSLAGSSGPGASSGPGGDHSDLIVRIASLEVENQNLRGVVQDLQQAISKLEVRLSTLEKSSPTHRATAPQTQHVSPMRQVEPPAKKGATPAEDDEDNDIDLFGSDEEEEDKEAARLREERLRQYAEKKAKKPTLVAKSSILLDVKPWDDETDMAQLETCVRSIQLDGLVWGASKLVPVGYGIRKLQIQCVVEDDKVGTDLLEEEITKFEEHVQSVDIAAFNKI
uniref:Pyrroline-5-carboxylate reductase 3 n=1 Tax=Rattus norvegicus TaxID=10116 RepID=A0A8I5Y6S6_RAT